MPAHGRPGALTRAWRARRRPRPPRARPGQAEGAVLRLMLADALEYRTAGVGRHCPDCDRSPRLLCADHAADLELAARYRELAEGLGVVVRDD